MKNFIDALRLQFNDVEKLGISDPLFVEFINNGMCLISQLRPERFARPKIMKASRGEVQCVDSCCSKLISVDGVVDSCGNPIGHINEGDTTLAKQFNKTPMQNTQVNYTFNLRDDAENVFEVSPAIKPSDDVYFRIMCVSTPEALTIDDDFSNCAYREAVMYYALSRAYGTEKESQTSMANSRMYLKMFYELIGIVRKLDKEDDDDS